MKFDVYDDVLNCDNVVEIDVIKGITCFEVQHLPASVTTIDGSTTEIVQRGSLTVKKVTVNGLSPYYDVWDPILKTWINMW